MSKIQIIYDGETIEEMLYFQDVVLPLFESVLKIHKKRLEELSKGDF